MKYLLINRHAESPWSNFNVSDHGRELSDNGFKEASCMGKRLFKKNISFDLMLASSATRALTTCQLIALEIKYPIENIRIDNAIYGADVESLKSIIQSTPNNIESLAVFGHNPTFHEISNELHEENILRFSPCSMLYVSFSTDDWKECFKVPGKSIFFDFPQKVIQ